MKSKEMRFLQRLTQMADYKVKHLSYQMDECAIQILEKADDSLVQICVDNIEEMLYSYGKDENMKTTEGLIALVRVITTLFLDFPEEATDNEKLTLIISLLEAMMALRKEKADAPRINLRTDDLLLTGLRRRTPANMRTKH